MAKIKGQNLTPSLCKCECLIRSVCVVSLRVRKRSGGVGVDSVKVRKDLHEIFRVCVCLWGEGGGGSEGGGRCVFEVNDTRYDRKGVFLS